MRTLWKRLLDDRPLVDLLYTLGIVSVERNCRVVSRSEEMFRMKSCQTKSSIAIRVQSKTDLAGN